VLGSISGFNAIELHHLSLLEHLDQIADLVNHAANFRRIQQLARAIDFAQSKATHRRTMRLLTTNRTTNELNCDFLLCRHIKTFD